MPSPLIYTDAAGNPREAQGVTLTDAVKYTDAAGNQRESLGVYVSDEPEYRDNAGNIREAVGVYILGGGGGDLPSNQAIVTDSEIVTAIGGQTIDIQVTDNVATFGVRSFPFWNPFTVTAADLGGSFGYQADVPDQDPGGAITNEPVDGYTLIWARTFLDGGNGILTLQMAGPRPLRDALQGALFGINAEDYTVAYDNMQVFEDSGVFYTNIEIYDVPMWTAGQSIPIVIIPQ